MNKEENLPDGTPLVGDVLEERKEKIINFLKKRREWIYYLFLTIIVYIGVYLRTRNIPKLKDITTGTWTLGPDLDPFLFLRWAKYIVENGSLMAHDAMRYVPLGYNTAGEMKLLSYMIAWFHNILNFFGFTDSVTYSAIIFPVFMFGLTTIAFFLFTKKIFYKESKDTRNIIALAASLFFVTVPSLLPRTIAGIPEKESAALFFMFMAFYFFLEAFSSEKIKRGIIFGILAGISSGLMALVWGGFIFVFLTIPISVFIAFLLGNIDKNKFYAYSCWLIFSFIIMVPFSTRYSIQNLVMSTSTGWAIGVFVIIGFSLIMINFKLFGNLRKKTKLPEELFYPILAVIFLLVAVTLLLGPGFLYGQFVGIKNSLITPIVDRFGMTVAENRQPYFAGEWTGTFGPVKFNIPLYFWLFFIGAVFLFNNLIKKLRKKERIILTSSYFIFLLFLIFSRYSPSSILNGVNGFSLFVYFSGWLLFIGSFGYIYYKRYQQKNLEIFKGLEFAYILYFFVFTLGLIGARGGIRLMMMLGAISPVAVGFMIVKISEICLKEKIETKKYFIGILMVIILISSLITFWSYYQQDKFTSENFAPSYYNQQWQKAMSWVRENTTKNAVFAHWWDYGYWVQSIGERATILDGGNSMGYWNHFMGRYVLTGPNETDALEFLYAHNGTHLLIDSTEIGKYTAYSSIGSDENYDRFSWINTFLIDEKQTQEMNNETTYVYAGGSATDSDIVLNIDNKEVFLPKKMAVIIGIILKENNKGEILQPEVVFLYNNNQYRSKIKYVYVKDKLYEFSSGLDAGIFIFPKLDTLQNGNVNINEKGALLYLSERTVHSQLARLYLFSQKSDYFKIAHTESNFIVESLRNQGLEAGEFLYYQGLQGPIKIWDISYPKDIEFKEKYLDTNQPKELDIAKKGEYN